jgi:rhamnosyl/mannosyltransferase
MSGTGRSGADTGAGQSDRETRRILQATKFYYPKVGGIEWVAHELAKAAVDRGDTVTALSAVEQGRGDCAVYDDVETRKAASLGTVLSVPIAPTYPIHLLSKKRPADLVHYHLPDPLSVTAELLTGDGDARTVATYHNDIARTGQRRLLTAYRPVLNRFLKRVDEIFVTSPRLRDRSPFLDPYRSKCTVVPLGIDLDEFGDYDGPAYDLPGDSSRPTVLFVGRLIYYKGLEYAVDAMRTLEADLLIAGTGDLRESLQRRAYERDVEDRVHFLGYVPDRKLKYCYETADVFVLPSVATSEGFGIVQLEAMAHRTPVVNTAIDTGVPWVSRNGKTGLTVPPRDSDSLAEALRRLLDDPEARERYGLAARERVEREFTLDRMVGRYLERYDALTG